ncbi:FAD:protein FMN transferase [Lichenifustis flavocetrariae]|uniref:FAD:protein FMN transferase n=1 Tax=Lichenifustis flavocetrariae TaxID=2949735 RepID=A0AA41ZBG8_9HYPH|nr:FAD:protein FMN transferase [Lichenifustis flavocetrariae]MCW6512822.1 FAD:protein FMN transferase [Lichenifustis flavocetrariae]
MSTGEAKRFEFWAMGTLCDVTLQGEQAMVEQVAAAAKQEVDRLEHKYSRYKPDSVLSQINASARSGSGVEVDDETAMLLDWAFDAFSRSGGLFDITSGVLRTLWHDGMSRLPDDGEISAVLSRIGLAKLSRPNGLFTFPAPGWEIDFGGLVKEYAADQAATICRASGCQHGLINLGGDMTVIGPHPDGTPWRIGIRNPARHDEALATVFLGKGGLATSGDYERFWEIDGRRYSHVLSPRTGWPINGLPSITVVGETCLSAGLNATIAMLQGDAAPAWLDAEHLPYLVVDRAGLISGSIHLS